MKNFYRLFLAIIALLTVSVAVKAQILYKIEKADSDKVSYILGTHHLAPLAVVDSITELSEILNSVDAVYGEIELKELQKAETMLAMQKIFIAPADSTLDKLITPVQLDSVKGVWTKYAGDTMPFDMLMKMKPSLISTQLASLVILKDLPDIDPMEGIDMTMQKRASELGKKVVGLETVEQQLNLVYGDPVVKQAESLMHLVREINNESTTARELTEAYLSHDLDKLLALMLESEARDPEAADKMIYSRNENWINKLLEIMPQESVLVVVGAGHLPGPKGMLEGFGNNGYKISPVK